MGLCSEVVDFIRANLADNLHHAHRIAEISVMEMEVRIVLQMCNSLAIIHGGTTNDSVYFISLFQKELRKVGSVLSGNAGDQSCLCHIFSPLSCCLSVLLFVCHGFAPAAKPKKPEAVRSGYFSNYYWYNLDISYFMSTY